MSAAPLEPGTTNRHGMTVVYRAANVQDRDGHYRGRYMVRCGRCGTEKLVDSSCFRVLKSCGCSRRPQPPNGKGEEIIMDLTGNAATYTVDRRILELAREQLQAQLNAIDAMLANVPKRLGRPPKNPIATNGQAGLLIEPAGNRTRLPAVVRKSAGYRPPPGQAAVEGYQRPNGTIVAPYARKQRKPRILSPAQLKAMRKNAARARAAQAALKAALPAPPTKKPRKPRAPLSEKAKRALRKTAAHARAVKAARRAAAAMAADRVAETLSLP